MTPLELMRIGPVVPVIVVDEIKHAVPMAQALVEGGIRVLEITLRTPVALEALSLIAREVKGAIVGAGTVTDIQKLELAYKAGAQFIITPGLTPGLAKAAKSSDIPLIPGVMTPSDVMVAIEHGISELKFFPAQPAGGINMLKALSGPFPEVTFCPTGGISVESAPQFLALSNVACVGGSWLTPKNLMEKEDWAAIRDLARQATSLQN